MLSEHRDIDLSVIDCKGCHQENFEEKKQSLLREIEKNIDLLGNPDILLTYRCPFIIPPTIFERVQIGAFNLHPSLLPKHKGSNPWEEIFRNHEQESGVTLHQLTKDIDSGTIVSQLKFTIATSDNIESARNKSDELARELVKDFISNMDFPSVGTPKTS